MLPTLWRKSLRPCEVMGAQSHTADVELKCCLPGSVVLGLWGTVIRVLHVQNVSHPEGAFHTLPLYVLSLGWLGAGACSSPWAFLPRVLLPASLSG